MKTSHITNLKICDIPRWVLAIVIIRSMFFSSYSSLSFGLGLFAFLFNVAQGKLIEGLVVGLFAFFVMLFLMQIALVRSLKEQGELDLFVVDILKVSFFSRFLISLTTINTNDV